VVAPPEPSDAELVAFAESLLRNLGPHLREHHVLVDAVTHHRATWLTLYEAARALNAGGTDAAPGT
jgi:hypothetical protein